MLHKFSRASFIRAILFSSALLVYGSCSVQQQPASQPINIEELKAGFLNPGPETRPGCYWYWMNDNVSLEGITKDLEAMARVGIGRAYLGHIYYHQEKTDGIPVEARYMTPVGDVKFMSDKWWEAVQWAVKEADRCGIEIGFFNSPGWSQSGAPWVKPSQSMRYLAHSETLIEGGKKVNQIIPPPEVKTFPFVRRVSKPTKPGFTQKEFQDVRIIAFKIPDTEINDFDWKALDVTSGNIEEVKNLFDGSDETFTTFQGNTELIIDLTLHGISELKSGIQSIGIKPLDDDYTLEFRIESSADGATYKHISEFSEQRGRQGPMIKEPILIPFPEIKSKYVRLIFNANKSVKIAEISVSRRAVAGGYVRKQLGETSPAMTPGPDAYVWPEQAEAVPGSALIAGEVVDLSDKMDADGRLAWDAPDGQWIVMRMGMIPVGIQCVPASPESRGLEVDKMNKEHIASLFDGMVGEFLRRTPEKDRKALKYVIADSYEAGPQNWTDGFIEKFETRFGYSPVPYLPVISGRIVESTQLSDRFLWDLRRLIVERIAYDYVGGLRDVCNNNDLTLWLENYGHWGFPSEFLLYGSLADQIGGEFWIGGVWDNIECRSAVSCGHTYGKNTIYAEAFTSQSNFDISPASMKKWCDWVYGVGVNHLILSVYIHQPDERKPGIIQWFGTDFNRHNPWFEQSKGFIDYMRRSSVLLKSGLPVIDVAYYVGENAPMMQGMRDPDLPDGYEYDFINSDVLINRCRVQDGRIIVRDGPSYSVLVLPPQNTMRPEVAEAIKRLVKDGASIIGPKPSRSPSLENYPECDQDLVSIANELWGTVDGESVRKREYGKGHVYDGISIQEVLSGKDLKPDVSISSEGILRCASAGSGKLGVGSQGGIVFNHRADQETDIYFLANTTDEAADFTASFRCAGKQPSFWNAVTSEIIESAAFTQNDGRTIIPLHLDSSESLFIVFNGKISVDANGGAKTNQPDYETIVELDRDWTVSFESENILEKLVFDTLIDWSKHANPEVRHFSGTANYERTFMLENPEPGKPVILDLGEVSIVATIYVNGNEAGTAWTTPWEIDISDFVEKGKNDLKIRISNVWYNRVLADSKLPEAERRTYISQPYSFKPDASLFRGGLLGPVKIKVLVQFQPKMLSNLPLSSLKLLTDNFLQPSSIKSFSRVPLFRV